MTPPQRATELDLPFVDYASTEFTEDRIGCLERARNSSWLIRTVRGIEVLDHAIGSEMMLDRDCLDGPGSDYYREQDVSGLILKYADEGMLPMITWERHDVIRRVLQRGFTAKRVEEQRPRIRDLANQLVDRFADDHRFDLVADFSNHYPIWVVCDLIGVPPADIAMFERWTLALNLLAQNPVKQYEDEIEEALTGLYAYFADLVAERRRQPGDDFVSAIIQAQGEEGRLSEGEMFGALINILFAGHDTTRFQLGWVMYLLLAHRDQWDRLAADRSLSAGAIDEAMRVEPSLNLVLRKVIKDVTYHDVLFPAGTFVSVNTLAANHDPGVFPQPHVFDIGRENANRHLTFGRGPRLCLGHILARAEMVEALKVFVERLPRLDFGGPIEYSSLSAAAAGPQRFGLVF